VVRVVTTPDGALLQPGTVVDLADKDEAGTTRAPSSRSPDPVKYGITVSDYFV